MAFVCGGAWAGTTWYVPSLFGGDSVDENIAATLRYDLTSPFQNGPNTTRSIGFGTLYAVPTFETEVVFAGYAWGEFNGQKHSAYDASAHVGLSVVRWLHWERKLTIVSLTGGGMARLGIGGYAEVEELSSPTLQSALGFYVANTVWVGCAFGLRVSYEHPLWAPENFYPPMIGTSLVFDPVTDICL